MKPTVLYTAAHGGFAGQAVPLGGGAAIFDRLTAEWDRTRPFEYRAITPSILGSTAPSASDIVAFKESDYARFCRAFELACTEEILRHDPALTVVLANDVSEGPNFARLARAGYRVFTIYHVDVVAYIADIYLKGYLSPETTVKWYPQLRWAMPDIARLIWEKQQASVECSRGLIVPSSGMKDVLLKCYPQCPESRLHVIPWGVFDPDPPPGDATALRREFGIPDNAKALLTLSRISPEKGIDALLEQLLRAELDDTWLFICGDAAFMRGEAYLDKLKRLVGKLKRTRVVFPGYIQGQRKRDFFALADLFVFPSRHESYGLTLMEALASGLPAVCLPSSGSREVVRSDSGRIVEPRGLVGTIRELLADDIVRSRMSAAARQHARSLPFARQAERLSNLVVA